MRIGGGAVSIADVTNRAARDLGFVRPFWLNEIRAARAFARSVALAASVGDFGHIQLFNPGGSGITIIVHKIYPATNNQQEFVIQTHNTALTTLVGTGINLLSGGAAGIGELRTENILSITGTQLYRGRILGSTLIALPLEWFMELGAGEGVLFTTTGSNEAHVDTFEWIEL